MKKESAFHASDLWVGAFEVCNAIIGAGRFGGREVRTKKEKEKKRHG